MPETMSVKPLPSAVATPNAGAVAGAGGGGPEATQLWALLGTSLRVLLADRRTIQGELESVDCNSLLLSQVLETRAPPLTSEEAVPEENRDRYYPRSDPHLALEIPGLGIARDIGMVVVKFTDVVKIEVDEVTWKRAQEQTGSIV